MTVSRSNLRFYLSGGLGNEDPASSLGGPISNSQVKGIIDALFPDVSGLQAENGQVLYRCVYFANDDDDEDGFYDPSIWLAQVPPESKIAIGVDPSGKNGEAQLVEDGNAPSGVVFSAPGSMMEALMLPGSPYTEGEYVPIWIRRTVSAGTPPIKEEAVLRIRGSSY